MKKFIRVFMMVIALMIITVSYSDAQTKKKWSHRKKGAVAGTAVGAGAGAMVAGKGHRGKGAVIGGAAGAAGGYILGKRKDKKAAQ